MLHAALVEGKEKINVQGIAYERTEDAKNRSGQTTAKYARSDSAGVNEWIKLEWEKGFNGAFKQISVEAFTALPSEES